MDLITIVTTSIIAFSNPFIPTEQVLSSHEISLENRTPDRFVNGVFKDNILLNMAYMDGRVSGRDKINWDDLRQPFQYEFKLASGQTFAFHEDVLPKYQDRIAKTSNAHFNGIEGFKSDGYLMGDGVCHLASLMYKVSKDAGLEVEAPTNHNFATINEISREYGVSIYYHPGRELANARQNLYITNNRNQDVTFRFNFDGDKLKLAIVQ